MSILKLRAATLRDINESCRQNGRERVVKNKMELGTSILMLLICMRRKKKLGTRFTFGRWFKLVNPWK